VTGIVARSGNDLVMPSQKASPIRAARFSLGDEPPVVRVEWVDVDVMASAEAASTAEGIAFAWRLMISVCAARFVSRGLAPAWIGSGGRNRGFVGR
jgi:hypothetical protein